MAEPRIRTAAQSDKRAVSVMLRKMLEEMVSFGGRGLVDEKLDLQWFDDRVAQALREENFLLLVAETPKPSAVVIGFLEARAIRLAPIYRMERTLHIHSIYVAPEHRHKGLGEALLRRALDWGKHAGCDEAELGTLFRNPARSLFEKLGFEAIELEMRRSIQ
jgi:ribosomal protein S18 acetylase RimI-like enzyme